MASCQTAKINNTKYNVSPATTELGSIGQATSLFKLKNDFETHSFPLLKNNIRLDIKTMPFNKKLYSIYSKKAESAQIKKQIQYADSIPVKPELVTISILDIRSYLNELNSEYNRNITTYLKDTEDGVVVTGLAVTFPKETLTQIKSADAYYLINEQEKKYTLALFTNGKKTSEIDLKSGTILGYTLGRFCWAIDERHNWYIADIVDNDNGCKGNTESKIKEKERTSLFKM
ncbi:hypothetical protein GCM10007424_11600 [Flavobacterium suaedae]|uniref:Lipoprotein n=2 Tax=Flavobacterium suaedae TaxID=1767027 RepID=A0ABQ1JRU0_9FLAO|nr:hypothetical protein GCM10007424_11600 [Flavobacterium suaedae]